MIAPNTDSIRRLIGEITETLKEIEKDYPRAEDIAYGSKSGSAGEGGGRRGTGVVGGHSDPTGETAISREAMRYTCVTVVHDLDRVRKMVDKAAARLDSSLRQSDDPHARAVRAEMADQARIVTRQEQRSIQDQRDRDYSAELQGRAEGKRQRRILQGWHKLGDRIAT